MYKNNLRHDKKCRLCGKEIISTLFKLNDTPLEDQFVSKEKKDRVQPTYPLELAMCDDCGYVHLTHIISPEVSYTEYVYESGVTVGLRNHYDSYAREIVIGFSVSQGSLAVDLGSNDGSMLASFNRAGMKVVGVEPAKSIADLANASGLKTINNYFTEKVASQIINDHGAASIITANYMYANIDNVIGFTRDVSKLLAPDGVFVVQTGYHPDQMKIKMFDYIYHEHFSYFTVKVIKELFSICGLELIEAKKISPKGGSIRVVGQLTTGKRKIDSSVEEIIREEDRDGMQKRVTYLNFAKEIEISKKQIIDFLTEIKESGKTIAGFGASHSTTTLTYHFELESYLDYIVDDNKLKHGTYSPGHHIPVYSTDRLYESSPPDYVLLLAWQHGTSIMERHRKYLSNNGHWIVPLPQLQKF
ncbi:MAG: class I SAM-dependent methyltransferase [Desulfobacteraceae bacterium]|nr:class I SAM-dependent methyltransferase [Desulfobacteraceae bacterium]